MPRKSQGDEDKGGGQSRPESAARHRHKPLGWRLPLLAVESPERVEALFIMLIPTSHTTVGLGDQPLRLER